MPKAGTKRATKRPAPYNLRASTAQIANMGTAIMSPVGWAPQHSHGHSLSWSDPHMGYQQHAMMQNPMPPWPTQAPAVQDPRPGQSTPWNATEDRMLMDARLEGLGWQEIKDRYFPTKPSGNACRKRYERLMLKLKSNDWDQARVNKVMRAYSGGDRRERFWRTIADQCGEKWEDVERVCFQQGLKNLRTTNSSHSRGRSRASSGYGAEYEAERAPSHEEYKDLEDSGISMSPTQHQRRSSHLVSPVAAPDFHPMRSYDYHH